MSSPETTAEAAEEETESERDELREEIVEQFSTLLEGGLVEHDILAGKDVWLRVAADAWPNAANAAKSLGFDYFCFLSAIDWMPSPFGRGMDSEVDKALDSDDVGDTAVDGADDGSEAPPRLEGFAGGSTRFQLLARLHSTTRRVGVTLKADVEGDEPSIGTWTNVYAGADWHEREAWEMFGIDFAGHPGLRHIYLPGDFEGRPLRKDFPLLARMVKPWPGIVDVEDMPGDDDGDSA